MAKGRARKETQDQPEGMGQVPMYFRSLSVENVLCFGPKQALDFTDSNGRPAHWTVILGDNGVGKTTLLQCLLSFRPKPLLENQLFVPEGNSSALLRGVTATRARLSAELYCGSTLRQSARYWFRCKSFKVSWGCNGQVSDFAETPKIYQEFRCYGYGASRRMGETSLSKPNGMQESADLLDENAPLINAEEWLLQADYSASKRSKIAEKEARRRDQIKKVLIDLLPDMTDIRITSPSEEKRMPTVEFRTPYGWVTMRGLSLGYRAMIAWTVDLASRLFERYPDSRNPLAEPAVVLVDEIDLHLHPSWQRKIIEYLSERFPNTQFIATAHSPLVVQAAEGANIVLLRREGDHVIIENKPESVRGWRVDQILTSDLFGLPSARPVAYERLLARRERILSKPDVTDRDRKSLADIEKELADWPVGENREEIEAMDIIRRAADSLRQRKKTRS